MVDVAVAVHDFLPRKGIQAALDDSDVARVVACLGDLEELDSVLREHQPEVLILDVRFRREDPGLLSTLARRHPSCRVLVLVPHKASECAFRHLLSDGSGLQLSPAAASRIDECCLTSLRGEARGCLACEASADEVVRAVTAVASGKVAAAGWLSAFADVGVGQVNGRPSITARELEVMALLVEGLGNKAIARKLGIREQTVKNHLARLMAKLGLSSRAQVGLVAARYHVRVTSTGDA
ncbi:MAG: response regulator transcription factor [Gemmatimonadetes bacterium]|nr:response regulator transcription factor [Gemmatimonadota bacterium]